MQGLLKLREELSKQNNSEAGNFVITNGASEALFLSIKAVVKPREKILLHTPYYYSYPKLLQMSGVIPVFTNTIKGKIDIEDFKNKINGCKAFLLNTPSNPTGIVQEKETLKQIEDICKKLNIMIISDEVYSSIIYENEHYSASGNNVITINSFSKTYSMCGYRVGYLHSHEKDIVEKASELKSYASMNTSNISQEIAFNALKIPKSFIEAQVKIWKERRDFIYKSLMDLNLDVWKPEGAFYVLPKIKDPIKAVWDLYKKHKVITYPGEWFGAPKRIRLSYALSINKIEEGIKRIKNFLNTA